MNLQISKNLQHYTVSKRNVIILISIAIVMAIMMMIIIIIIMKRKISNYAMK